MQNSFIKVGCAVNDIKVSDCKYNTDQIISLIEKANSKKIKVLTFPELSITGYTCGDLFTQSVLIEAALKQLNRIVQFSIDIDMVIVVGIPISIKCQLYNTAAVICKGKILAIIPKTYIPNRQEYYEKRWFAPANNKEDGFVDICNQHVPFGTNILISEKNNQKLVIGVELCEDLWAPIPPSSIHSLQGATLLLNLSASNETVGKYEKRENLIKDQSSKVKGCYIYASSGLGESTSDLVYSGYAAISECGRFLDKLERFSLEPQLICADVDLDQIMQDRRLSVGFSEVPSSLASIPYRNISFEYSERDIKGNLADRYVCSTPFIPKHKSNDFCAEVLRLQAFALIKKFKSSQKKTLILGISGGLDSTLALFACVRAAEVLKMDKSCIIGVTMPGPGTTQRTYKNSLGLMEAVGVQIRDISIQDSVERHLKNIRHPINKHDVTYEQTQSRERTKILMDLANQEDGIVIGTGDMSELALGWMTYSGDQISMYGINSGVPKTVVKQMIRWLAEANENFMLKEVLDDILDTPISPELLPLTSLGEQKQKTEDLVGPYELHDFYMYYILRYGESPNKLINLAELSFGLKYTRADLLKWLKIFYTRFFTRQFKRNCFPDGPQIFEVALSPRGYWRMPSDASFELWIAAVDEMLECEILPERNQ